MTFKPAYLIAVVSALTVAACAPHNDRYYDDERRVMDHYFDKMDSNDDGVISKAEARIYADMEFQYADMNNNGVVTREEFADAKARKKQMYDRYDDDNYRYNRYESRYDRYGKDHYNNRYNHYDDRYDRRY